MDNHLKFHDYVLSVPIKNGTVAVDFFSGNIVQLEDIDNQLDGKKVDELKKLGFLRESSEKLSLLKERWEEVFLKDTIFTFVLDTAYQAYRERLEVIDHQVASKSLNNVNLKLTIDKEIPVTFLECFRLIDDTKYTITLDLNSTHCLVGKDNLQKVSSFISHFRNLGVSVILTQTIHEPNELTDILNSIRKLSNELDMITVKIRLKEGDRAESIMPFADVYFKHLLYSVIHHTFIVPGTMSLNESIFHCTFTIDFDFYQELFKTLYKHNLNRFMKVYGGGVLRSIRAFMDTNMFFPPMLTRCRSGSLAYFNGSSVVCCAKQGEKHDSLSLRTEDLTSLLNRSLTDYRKSHLLFSGLDKENFSTYGGTCPLKTLKEHNREVKNLLTPFFNEFFYWKGCDLH